MLETAFHKIFLRKNGDAIIDKLFTSGRAIAVVNGSWTLEKYAKAGINIGIALLPKLKNGRRLAPFFWSERLYHPCSIFT